jgi:hemerythrin-like metal-binding protein
MVRSVEAIENAVKRGADPAMLAELLAGLVERTREHFTTEEGLMERTRYSQGTSHAREHQRLLKQLEHLRELYASGRSGSATGLIESLRPWLVEHIEGADRHLADHIRRRPETR